jgi:hypothetical protein
VIGNMPERVIEQPCPASGPLEPARAEVLMRLIGLAVVLVLSLTIRRSPPRHRPTERIGLRITP